MISAIQGHSNNPLGLQAVEPNNQNSGAHQSGPSNALGAPTVSAWGSGPQGVHSSGTERSPGALAGAFSAAVPESDSIGRTDSIHLVQGSHDDVDVALPNPYDSDDEFYVERTAETVALELIAAKQARVKARRRLETLLNRGVASIEQKVPKMTTSAHASSASKPQVADGRSQPASEIQGPSRLDELPLALKDLIAQQVDFDTKKALRLASRSCREAVTPYMKKLTMSAEDIGKLRRSLASMPALTEVTITAPRVNADASLQGIAHLAAEVCARISALDVRQSDITCLGLAHLHLLTQLQSLTLHMCDKVTDADLAHLQGLTLLQSLDLSSCRELQAFGLVHLQPMTRLRSLNLSWCSNLIDAGLSHLEPLKQLESLDLSGCRALTDTGLANLGPLRGLRALNLRMCDAFTGSGLANLQQLTQLESLDLSGCKQIIGASLQDLRPLTQLQSLDLSGCENITNDGLVHLESLKHLQSLKLSGCEALTDAGVADLASMTQLQSLDLSDCEYVTDAGIALLQPLKKLRSLNLSGSDAHGYTTFFHFPFARHF